jgi:hypothetical protein
MTWLNEAHLSIIGSLRLAVRDEGGFGDFNLTESGFWRSFSAIVILAPLYLYGHDIQGAAVLAETATTEEDIIEPSMIVSTIELLIQWVAWPIAMALIAKFTGLTAAYSRYITVYNWSAILVGVVQIIPIFLYAQGGTFAELGSILMMISLAFAIYYRWYIAQTALKTTATIASALVLADLVLSFGIIRFIG